MSGDCGNTFELSSMHGKKEQQGVSNETCVFAAAHTHLCYKLGQIQKILY